MLPMHWHLFKPVVGEDTTERIISSCCNGARDTVECASREDNDTAADDERCDENSEMMNAKMTIRTR